ncbi:hypothetical protein BC830DRAFT_1083512 [Chytriomyces sp. MP71]|nr:hypothetical protein BC830DRAFT_1083512 [Chytriomyces sp. MP71]
MSYFEATAWAPTTLNTNMKGKKTQHGKETYGAEIGYVAGDNASDERPCFECPGPSLAVVAQQQQQRDQRQQRQQSRSTAAAFRVPRRMFGYESASRVPVAAEAWGETGPQVASLRQSASTRVCSPRVRPSSRLRSGSSSSSRKALSLDARNASILHLSPTDPTNSNTDAFTCAAWLHHDSDADADDECELRGTANGDRADRQASASTPAPPSRRRRRSSSDSFVFAAANSIPPLSADKRSPSPSPRIPHFASEDHQGSGGAVSATSLTSPPSKKAFNLLHSVSCSSDSSDSSSIVSKLARASVSVGRNSSPLTTLHITSGNLSSNASNILNAPALSDLLFQAHDDVNSDENLGGNILC